MSTLGVAGNLGSALLDQGKHSDAEAVYRDTLERQREVLGPEHASTLRTASSLATALQNQGKYAEAEPVLRDTLAIQQRVLGEGDIITLATAAASRCCSATPASTPKPRRWAAVHWPRPTARWGPTTPSLAIARTLAITLSKHGQAAEAEPFQATLATQQRVLGPGHPDTQTTVQALRRFQQRG